MNKLLMGFGAMAALMLGACSSEEPVITPDESTSGDGSIAYMKVSINTTGNSRASSDDGFEAGTEHEVDNANFYFYTAGGAYVTSAQIWKEGTASTGNIEFSGNPVLVLKDLNEAKAPAYLVTVLNAPADFTPGNTLAEMATKLSNAADDAAGYAYTKTVSGVEKQYFTMSTTSYVRTSPGNEYEYFTTKVKYPDNFLHYTVGNEPTPDEIAAMTPVAIHVERLAAKVSLTCPAAIGINVGGKKYFKLTVSKGSATNTGSGSAMGNIQVAEKALYICIEGWGLNNLTQHSYMMKNLTYAENNEPFNNWHSSTTAVGNFRNYWANAADIYGVSNSNVLAHFSMANHMTGGNFNKGLDDYDYCFENTNTASVLRTGDNLGNLATSVMVYAKIYESSDESTFTAAGDLISYNGIIFKQSDFINLIIASIQNSNVSGAKKFAKKTSSSPDTYVELEAADVKLVAVAGGENKGEVLLTLKSKDGEWYTYTGSALPANPTFFTASTVADVNAALKTAIETSMSGNITAAPKTHAYCLTGGMMYYNVPIEHYRNASPSNPILEGEYGVVRNHIYKVDITSLTKLGKAIFDPSQVIIPDTPKGEERYALGVKVNILSWKVVSQSVPL